jgi:ATP-dependent Clp protease ATP-binding subunit ClpX
MLTLALQTEQTVSILIWSVKGRKITTCSFCGKTSREVGPMVEGPNEVYICSNCVDLCQNIFRRSGGASSGSTGVLRDVPSPRGDQGIPRRVRHRAGPAKRALAVAVHNHYKRLLHGESEDATTSSSTSPTS